MRETAEKGWFWYWGERMYRFRKPIVVVWVVLFLVLGYFAQQAPGLLKDNGFTPRGSESDVGLKNIQEQLGFPPSAITLVYQSEGLDLTTPQQTETILKSLEHVKQLPYVASIQPNDSLRIAKNGDEVEKGLTGSGIQTINVALNLDTDHALEKYPELKSRVHAPEGMKVEVTGGPAILYDMQDATKRDIVKAEMFGLPIALIVLFVVFGTLPGALLPMVVGIASVSVTLGVTYFVAQSQSLSNFLPNMVTMLGLAVGIDYALFMVSRFREELGRSGQVGDAVAMTCQMAGKSIFFSGIAVLIGLFGMSFIDLTIFRSLCIGGVLVVLSSVIVANTLLLALLGMFGHKINSFRVLPLSFHKGDSSRFWERVAYFVMKRPLIPVVVIGALLVTLMIPVGSMLLGVPDAEVLPPKYESRHGSDLLNKVYDKRELTPIQLSVGTKGEVWEEASIASVRRLTDEVKSLPGVKEVKSYLTPMDGMSPAQVAAMLGQVGMKEKLESAKLAKGNSAVIAVVPSADPDHAHTDTLIRQLRDMPSGDLEVLVTGGPAYRLDIVERINERLPLVVGFVMIVTYLVLLAAFRSALLPLKAVIMNVLSLGASLGLVVTVFQDGFMAEALRVSSTGYVSATLPVIIFCVVFGISMDYEVFLISRIIEEYERTGDNDRSTAEGLKKTGSLITSAAFILIVVVGSFIFTDIEIIKALGLGLALAVFIDATLVRIILVPALMKMLGSASWWAPRWMRRKPVVPRADKALKNLWKNIMPCNIIRK